MPSEMFRQIIDDLAAMGFTGTIGTAVLCGPLLDKRILELFSYARQKLPGSKIHLATNGDALTAERCRELLEHAFTTIRITEHDDVFMREDEFRAFSTFTPCTTNGSRL